MRIGILAPLFMVLLIIIAGLLPSLYYNLTTLTYTLLFFLVTILVAIIFTVKYCKIKKIEI